MLKNFNTLKLWYPMSKDTNDYSPMRNSPIDAPTSDNGVLGKALNPGNTQIKITGTDGIRPNDIGTVATICFWFKANTANDNLERQIFGAASIHPRTHNLFNYPGQLDFHGSYGGGSWTYNGFFPNDTWTHATVVCDGTESRIYRDGALYATSTFVFSPQSAPFGDMIVNSANGHLCDLRVYKEALGEGDINAIMDDTLVLRYRFNSCKVPNMLVPRAWSVYEPYNKFQGGDAYNFVVTVVDATKYLAVYPTDFNANGKNLRVSGRLLVNGNPWVSRISAFTNYGTESVMYADPETGYFALDIFNCTGIWMIHMPYSPEIKVGDSVAMQNIKIGEIVTDPTNMASSQTIGDLSGLGHHAVTDALCPPFRETEGGSYFFNNNRVVTKNLVLGSRNKISIVCKAKLPNQVGGGNYHILVSGATPTFDGGNIEQSITSAGDFRVGFYIDGTRRVFTYLVESSLLDNTWHEFCSTYDGSAIRAYIDGVLVGTTYISGTLDITRELVIGHWKSSQNQYWAASTYIKEVSIYNRVLYQDYEHHHEKIMISSRQAYDLLGSVTSIVDDAYDRTLLDYSGWTVGETQSLGVSQQPWTNHFYRNGTTAENIIREGINPAGVRDVMWATDWNDTANDGDGGWATGKFNISNGACYRFSIWVRKYNTSGDGSIYWGTHGYGSDGSTQLTDMAGNLNSNPYFVSTADAFEGRWVLIVGFVYSYSATTTSQSYMRYVNEAGVYKADGSRIWGSSEIKPFKWTSSAVSSNARVYLYYDASGLDKMEYYRPRVDVMDSGGSGVNGIYGRNRVPTIQELLTCKEHAPLINAPATTVMPQLGRNVTKATGIVERDIANGLIGHWNFALGHGNDLSGNNNHGVPNNVTYANGGITTGWFNMGTYNNLDMADDLTVIIKLKLGTTDFALGADTDKRITLMQTIYGSELCFNLQNPGGDTTKASLQLYCGTTTIAGAPYYTVYHDLMCPVNEDFYIGYARGGKNITTYINEHPTRYNLPIDVTRSSDSYFLAIGTGYTDGPNIPDATSVSWMENANGVMYEVRIYDRMLTEDEYLTVINDQNEPYGLYKDGRIIGRDIGTK